jgi:hypothetical protein
MEAEVYRAFDQFRVGLGMLRFFDSVRPEMACLEEMRALFLTHPELNKNRNMSISRLFGQAYWLETSGRMESSISAAVEYAHFWEVHAAREEFAVFVPPSVSSVELRDALRYGDLAGIRIRVLEDGSSGEISRHDLWELYLSTTTRSRVREWHRNDLLTCVTLPVTSPAELPVTATREIPQQLAREGFIRSQPSLPPEEDCLHEGPGRKATRLSEQQRETARDLLQKGEGVADIVSQLVAQVYKDGDVEVPRKERDWMYYAVYRLAHKQED